MKPIKATIYHNPKCSKSRAALKYLEKYNIGADIRLYIDTGITRAEIFDILELIGGNITDIIRVEEEIFSDNYTSNGMLLSKEGFINALTTHPILLERPIILFKEKGIGAICRSEDSLESLFQYVGIDFKTETEIVDTK